MGKPELLVSDAPALGRGESRRKLPWRPLIPLFPLRCYRGDYVAAVAAEGGNHGRQGLREACNEKRPARVTHGRSIPSSAPCCEGHGVNRMRLTLGKKMQNATGQ